MNYKNASHQAAVMSKVKKFQQNGFTGYSVALRKKVSVKPSDKIEVRTTKLKNGNHSVMVIGHTSKGKIPRIVGQF